MSKYNRTQKFCILIICLCMGITSAYSTEESRSGIANTKEINRIKPKPNPHHHDRRDLPVRVMTDEEVTEVISVVKSMGFDKDKVRTAVLFAKLCPISADGLGKIAKTIDFEDTRVDFLVQAYPYCIDKENYVKLRKVFTFSKNADELFNRLGL